MRNNAKLAAAMSALEQAFVWVHIGAFHGARYVPVAENRDFGFVGH